MTMRDSKPSQEPRYGENTMRWILIYTGGQWGAKIRHPLEKW